MYHILKKSIHQWMDMWVVSTFFFFTILNNTAIEHLCTVLCGHLFSNLLSVYLEVEFLGYTVTLRVNF